jgi:hypothetical protein
MNRSGEVEELIDLARREGMQGVHESYRFDIGKVVKAHAFNWREVPALLRPRPHVVYFYLGIVLALLTGAGILVIWRQGVS